MMMIGTIPMYPPAETRKKKKEKCKTVLFHGNYGDDHVL